MNGVDGLYFDGKNLDCKSHNKSKNIFAYFRVFSSFNGSQKNKRKGRRQFNVNKIFLSIFNMGNVKEIHKISSKNKI